MPITVRNAKELFTGAFKELWGFESQRNSPPVTLYSFFESAS